MTDVPADDQDDQPVPEELLAEREALTAQRTVGQNVVALATSQSITWVMASVAVWLIPRYLEPVDVGRLGVAAAVWAIATMVCQFGTGVYLSASVARRREIARPLTAVVIRLRLAIYVLVFPVVVVVIWLGPQDRETLLLTVAFGVLAGIAISASSLGAALEGLQEMGETSKIDVVSKLLSLALLVPLLLLGAGVVSVIGSSFASGVLALGLLAWALRRRAPDTAVSDVPRAKAVAIGSLPFLAAGGARILYQQIDTIVLSSLVGPEPIGFYAAADTLFGSLLFLPMVVTTALFPAMAEMHARQPAEVINIVRRVFGPITMVATLIGVGTIVVSGSFVRFLYGEKYAPSGEVLGVFGVVVVLTSISVLLGRLAQATDRAGVFSVLLFGAALMTIPLDIILVPIAEDTFDNAALAGPLAYVATESLLVIGGIWVLKVRIFDRELVVRLLKTMVAATLMFAASWPLRDRFFVVPGFVGVAVFVIAILVMGATTEDERDVLRRLSGRVGARLGRRSR